MQLLRARLISEFNQFVVNFLVRYTMTFLHSKYKLIYITIYIIIVQIIYFPDSILFSIYILLYLAKITILYSSSGTV